MKRLKLFAFAFLLLGGILIFAQEARAQQGYGLTRLDYYDDQLKIDGYSLTSLDYQLAYYYDASVDGFIYDDYGNILDYDRGDGSAVAEAYTSKSSVQRGQNYYVISDHYVETYFVYYGYYYDPYGLSGFSGNYSPPYYFQQGPSAYLYYTDIYVGSTGVGIQVPQPAPHITQIAPDAAIQADVTVDVQIEGTNFGTSPTINVSGNGISASYVNQTPNGIEAYFQVSATADIGSHDVTVTANGQTSNAVAFRIGDHSPVITSITPPEGSTGEQVSVTIYGSNFGLNPEVAIDGFGVSRNIISASSTEIQAVFSVADSTYAGNRNVSVVSRGVTGNGFAQAPGNSDTSNIVGFEVIKPLVSITDVGIVEKNGLKEITVGVPVAGANDKTKFRIRRLSGTGSATFEDGSTETAEFTGFLEPTVLKIKGVTESSEANNFTIEALLNGSSANQPHNEFTVATISALVFEKFDAGYADITANPGNGQPNTDVGLRIFPDKKTPADTTDRALIKVKATVSPSLPNARVYFGTYDLDDPSANAAPIDANASDGKDNNGAVNGSKSGDFTVPSGFNCSSSSAGTSSEYISKTDCAIASDGTATAAFKTTMQPGDNFAIAAGLTDTSRSAIKVNSSDGSKLIDAANKNIPISGEQNTDGVPTIRTQMLTVWRSLHTEVDSMGNVTGNKVEGTFPAARRISSGRQTLTVNVSSPLEPNRFDGGRVIIGSRSFRLIASDINASPPVDANTADTITILNSSGAFNISSGQSFTLYDDDDFDDGDGAILDGDEGEILPGPDTSSTSLIASTDTACSETITSNCNILAPAYIKPVYDLAGSHDKTSFLANINVSVISPAPPPSEIYQTYNFFNATSEDSSTFWTIYLSSAYQYDIRLDGDPNGTGAVLGITDDLLGNARGSLLFLETTRVKEAGTSFGTPPISRTYTMAHEIGHIFDGRHEDFNAAYGITDAGLMAQTTIRKGKTFNAITINKMRGGTGLTHP